MEHHPISNALLLQFMWPDKVRDNIANQSISIKFQYLRHVNNNNDRHFLISSFGPSSTQWMQTRTENGTVPYPSLHHAHVHYISFYFDLIRDSARKQSFDCWPYLRCKTCVCYLTVCIFNYQNKQMHIFMEVCYCCTYYCRWYMPAVYFPQHFFYPLITQRIWNHTEKWIFINCSRQKFSTTEAPTTFLPAIHFHIGNKKNGDW